MPQLVRRLLPDSANGRLPKVQNNHSISFMKKKNHHFNSFNMQSLLSSTDIFFASSVVEQAQLACVHARTVSDDRHESLNHICRPLSCISGIRTNHNKAMRTGNSMRDDCLKRHVKPHCRFWTPMRARAAVVAIISIPSTKKDPNIFAMRSPTIHMRHLSVRICSIIDGL